MRVDFALRIVKSTGCQPYILLKELRRVFSVGTKKARQLYHLNNWRALISKLGWRIVDIRLFDF